MGYDIAWEARGVYPWFFGTVTACEFMESSHLADARRWADSRSV
jgi:hypothetical protein